MPNVDVNKPNKKILFFFFFLISFKIVCFFYRTPLHNAVKHDCPEAVEMLLDYEGIDINPKDVFLYEIYQIFFSIFFFK